VGVTGEVHPRGSMGLANIAYSPVLTWANPTQRRLETQALVPMFGEEPVELGLSGAEAMLLARLAEDPKYQSMFATAFPGEANPITLANLTRALASFQRTLLSGRSPYDRYRTGEDPAAISESAKRGESLFFSEQTECSIATAASTSPRPPTTSARASWKWSSTTPVSTTSTRKARIRRPTPACTP
jgi:cytochrome c peroxidase